MTRHIPQAERDRRLQLDWQPIEDAIPNWLGARSSVIHFMPYELTLAHQGEDPSVVGFDLAWLGKAFSRVPASSIEDTKALALKVMERLYDFLTEAGFQEKFAYHLTDRRGLDDMNHWLRLYDEELKAHRLPTSMDLLKHALGIKADARLMFPYSVLTL